MNGSQGKPVGLIPAVEAQWSHSEFVDAVVPETVVLKMTHARRLLKRGENADSYFPSGTDVITTTTITDEQLALIDWEKEIELVRDFGPEYHIPADESVYLIDDPQQRTENIIQCMHGTLWMADQLSDNEIEIIPQIKGLSPIERSICYETFADNDVGVTGEYVAYYGTQYYTGGRGARTDELVEDVQAIADEHDPAILLLGVLAPSALTQLPSNVVAASGQNAWRSRTTPRTQSPEEIREEYRDLTTDVKQALSTAPEATNEDESEDSSESTTNTGHDDLAEATTQSHAGGGI